jgi:hypothetical protein
MEKTPRKIWNPEKFPIWQKFMDENLSGNSLQVLKSDPILRGK